MKVKSQAKVCTMMLKSTHFWKMVANKGMPIVRFHLIATAMSMVKITDQPKCLYISQIATPMKTTGRTVTSARIT